MEKLRDITDSARYYESVPRDSCARGAAYAARLHEEWVDEAFLGKDWVACADYHFIFSHRSAMQLLRPEVAGYYLPAFLIAWLVEIATVWGSDVADATQRRLLNLGAAGVIRKFAPEKRKVLCDIIGLATSWYRESGAMEELKIALSSPRLQHILLMSLPFENEAWQQAAALIDYCTNFTQLVEL